MEGPPPGNFIILLSVKICQCLLVFWAICTFLLFSRVLLTTPVYHRNLCVLLISIVFQHILTLTPYACLDMKWVLGYHDDLWDEVLLFIHSIGSTSIVFNVPIIVVERLYSFIYVDKYEHMNATVPWLSLILISFQFVWSTLFLSLAVWDLIPPMTNFGISVGAFLCGNLLSICIPICARRAFLNIRKDGGSISKRYQSIENLKASKMLMRLSVFIIVSSSIEYIYAYVHVFIFNQEENAVSSSLLILVWELDFFCTISIVTSSNRSLYHKFRELLPSCCGRFVRPSKISNVVQSTDGKQLVFNVEDHKKLYFKAYETMWK